MNAKHYNYRFLTPPPPTMPVTWPNPEAENPARKHSHYYKDVSKLDTIDVYRVLQLFGVTDPCIQHAVKKLLVAGLRGHKDLDKDVKEAVDSLVRYQEMRAEDNKE